MNYAKIKHYCIANGPGIRTALFVQGCPIHCVGCFNESTWDFNGGKPFNSNTYNEICNSLSEHTEHIAGLSILGGEGCFDINDLLVAGTTIGKSIILLRFDEGTCNDDVQEVHNFKRFDGRPFITCPKPDGFGGKFGFYSFA